MKKENIETKIQVDSSLYCSSSYTKLSRLISFAYQIDEILKCDPKEVLEIGVGNGFVSDFVKKIGKKITTLDFDKNLNPDVVADIRKLPLADNSYEMVACFEVLEHLPFECFKDALDEMKRVGTKFIILSLPDVRRNFRMLFTIPKIGLFKKLVTVPNLNPIYHKFDGEHYWEIGKKGYELSKIFKIISENDLEVINHYRVFENPYHHMFIIKLNKR